MHKKALILVKTTISVTIMNVILIVLRLSPLLALVVQDLDTATVITISGMLI